MAQQVVTELVIDGRAAKVGADQYSAAMEKASAATQHLTAANDQAQAAISRQTVTMTQSISRQAAQFGRIEAAVNPVIAAHQKLERATIAGNAALAKGIITQEQYNATIGKYKVLAEEASAASGTLLGQMGGIEGVLKGFGLGLGIGELLKLPGEIRDIVHEAAGLTHVAAAIGITTDRLQELQFAGSRVHVTTETMDAALEKFSRNLGVASQGTGDLSKILAMNHVKISGDVSKDFLAVANLVERATNAEQRNVIVTAAFGKNAEEMGLLFEHGAAGIEAAAAEAQKFGAVIASPDLQKMEEVDKRINDITNSLSIGFKKAVVGAVGLLDDLITKNQEISNSLDELVATPSWKAFVRVLFGGDDTGGIPKIGVINIPGHGVTERAPGAATMLPSAASDAAIKEAEHLRKQFDEAENSTVKATNALLAHAVAVGQGVQAAAAYEKQQELLNLALQNHIKLSAGEIENINKIGEAYGAAALKLAEAKAKSDLAFERGQIFRTAIEQNVAGALRDLYGDAWQKHADDAIAKQMRVNDELRTAKGYAEDFTQTLVQGLMRGDSLTATLADSLTNLSSSLASSAIKDLMGGNFIGAAVSGIGAVISGIFGHNEEEKKKREEAQKAWTDMAGDVAAFSVSLSGTFESSLGKTISDAQSRLDDFAKSAAAAGVDISGLRDQFEQFRTREIVNFRRSFAAELAALRSGTGASDAFAQGAQAVAQMRDQLLGFVADARVAFGPGTPQVRQARQAGRAAVLSNLGETPDISQAESEFQRLQGARQESIKLLHQLGLTLAEATKEVNAKIRASVADLRKSFVGDLQAQINEATGHGVFNQIQTLVTQNLQQLHDAQILGVNASLVNQAFQAQAQAVVDNERLTGNAFDALIARFPKLAGVVHEFTGVVEDQAARIDQLNGVAKTVVDYVNNLRAGTASTLSPQDRLAAAQASYGSQIALAQGGSIDAQAGITKYADDLLNAARALYASSQGYQDIFSAVTSQLLGLPAVQQTTDPVVVALRDAIAAIQATTDAVSAQTLTLSQAILAGPAAAAAALIPQFDRIAGFGGVIDFTEFAAALQGVATDATLHSIFNAIDTNGDGVITRLEAQTTADSQHAADQLAADSLNRTALVAAIGAGPAATAAALLPHFNTLDTNVNGLLDVNELRTALAPLASNAQIAALISTFDTNGDGMISKLELVRQGNVTIAANTGQVAAFTFTIASNTGATVSNTAALHALTVALKHNTGTFGKQFDKATNLQLKLMLAQQAHLYSMDFNLMYLANALAGVYMPRQKPNTSVLVAAGYSAAEGGIIGRFAPGGIVGNGLWNVDSVRARYAGGGDVMLAGGEGVINASATSMIGPAVIDLINRTGRLPANDNGPHFALQNRVLATGFSAVVNGLRGVQAGLAELRDASLQLERRARINASREPPRKSGTDG